MGSERKKGNKSTDAQELVIVLPGAYLVEVIFLL